MARPARSQDTPCEGGISPYLASLVFETLKAADTDQPCKLEAVGTERTFLDIRWSRQGEELPLARLAPRPCLPQANLESLGFQAYLPPETASACPGTAPTLREALHQLDMEDPSRATGSTWDPLFLAAVGLWIAFFGLTISCLASVARTLRTETIGTSLRWAGLACLGFLAAAGLRAALPFSLGNWYSEVLPLHGPPPWMRFGPATFALAWLARLVGLWGPVAFPGTQILLGSAAIPLLIGLMRALRLNAWATIAAALLLVVNPFHARLSASSSEHVLGATLGLALAWSWLRAAHSSDRRWLVAAILLFPLVCTTRVDMAGQATLLLLWPFVRDRREVDGDNAHAGMPPWPGHATLMAGVACLTLFVSYVGIAVPSHHPLPETWGRWDALRRFVPQFWTLATQPPGWFSPVEVVLAAMGGLVLSWRRPRLAIRLLVTIAAGFVWLGRTFLPDELLAARYFLLTIPLFSILAGVGFESVLRLVPIAARRLLGIPALCLLGPICLWFGGDAYQTRYTFQDEYSFAHQALANLEDGCEVYQVQLRLRSLPRDLDCCLDLPRSPITLAFPNLRFRYLPEDLGEIIARGGCVAFFDGATASIQDPNGSGTAYAQLRHTAAEYFARRRSQALSVGNPRLVAEATVSPRTTIPLFGEERPWVRLYRW